MNLCTLSRRPRADGRNKCSSANFGPNGRRDDRPFSMANNNNNNYGTQHTANSNNKPSMHPFKGLKGSRGSGLTSACRNSFDSDDPELEEIEFNKRDRPGFQSFSDDIDLNLDEVEPIYSEPEFKNEQREFDFHIYDLLSVREGSYRCSQADKQQRGGKSQQESSERRGRVEANDKKSWEQGKEYCQRQGGERLWGGGGGQPQKSHHWSQLGLLSDPQVSQWSQLGGGQLSSDSDYASYDASVPLCPASGRGETGFNHSSILVAKAI